jgi:hypothetical protein
VGVTHLPRTAGTARGAKPKVIFRALSEVWHMYPELSRIDSGRPRVRDEPALQPAPPIAIDHHEDLRKREAAV